MSIVLTVVIIILLASFLIVPRIMGERLVHPKVRDPQVCFEEKVGLGIIDADKYKAVEKKPFVYKSEQGLELKGEYIFRDKKFASEKLHKVIVLVHGYTSNYFDMLPYADMFYRHGFDVVVYDHRNHGYGKKSYTTMGLEESKDLEGVIALVREEFGEDCKLGLLGESMGAATVMLVSYRVNPAFVIEDCGYSSAYKELVYVGEHDYHLLGFPYAELTRSYVLGKYNFDLKQVLPAQSVARCPEDLPFLFIHGDSDKFVPSKMLLENYNSKKGNREMKYFKGASHAQSYRENVEEYEKLVEDFLEKNNFIKK